MNKDYVYDVEFFQNFFSVCLTNFPDRDERLVFEISSRRDDREELLKFLKQDGLRLIGFNNVGYDYPVLHHLIDNPEVSLMQWWKKIQRDLFSGEKRNVIWESNRYIPQIDLFKINHYDNKAKMTSLKWLEFTKNWYKVQDLPIAPHELIDESLMDDMIEYNWNDVEFTYILAKDNWNAVQFRENMTKTLGRNVMDYSDVKIGEYLNRKKYEELSGRDYRDFKDKRTNRKKFDVKDIIPNCVDFKSDFMKSFLDRIKKMTFYEGLSDATKSDFKFDILFNKEGFIEVVDGGLKGRSIKATQQQLTSILTFAKGGLHTVDMPRVVNRKEDWVLMEKDVGSMYPRSIIVDKVYPEHLGVEWNQGIANAYNYRLDILKPKLKELEYKSDEWNEVNDEQAVYKLAMNGGGDFCTI